MKVLVTGANGMVARAVVTYCTSVGDELQAFTREQLDISDREKVRAAVAKAAPDVLFNCAAYTDVDGAEMNEASAYAANAAGPENLAAACGENGVTFVTLSTDYVFDGTKDGFYTQDDRPNPLSAYARSKYEGELRSAAANPASVIVRSGWIYGQVGTNFLSVLPRMISLGEPFRAIDDAFGTPTFAGDLAVRLRELAEAKAAGIFHATNEGEGLSYFEFATEVADALEADRHMIRRVSDAALSRPAARPRNSRLACVRSDQFGLGPLRYWKKALHSFLEHKKGGI